MTPTNNQIHKALYSRLADAALGYTIIPTSVGGAPPDTGVWLETSFFSNQPLDNALGYDSGIVPRGIFQVACVGRKADRLEAIYTASEAIHALYAKGTTLTGQVRVVRQPYDMELEIESDRLMVVVSIEYSG